MDVQRTIRVLEQAKREIEQAVQALNSGDSKTASYRVNDSIRCLMAADTDIGATG